ncbi:MAG TPA: ribokinase [Planctomycetota bacterium]|nr:ribokinase [Planctomycetota bacterium]
MSNSSTPRIVVVGSINLDLVVRCSALPRPGQTLTGDDLHEHGGGKGANQAVAAARLGARTTLIGRVGDDGAGQRLRACLATEGVAVPGDLISEKVSSGTAIIAVERGGENHILLVPGANALLTPSDVEHHAGCIRSAQVLLLQLEIPTSTVIAAARIARTAGVRVLLDPAPAPLHFDPALFVVDLLSPNRSEAEALVGRPLSTITAVTGAARELVARGAGAVVITLGADGAVLCVDGKASHLPTFSVNAVDATAAGDAFKAALAVRWAEGAPLDEAVRFALAAGALAASRAGAQPSLPRRHEVDALIASHSIAAT